MSLPNHFDAPGRNCKCAYTSLLLYLIASLIAMLPANLILLLLATNQPTEAQLSLTGKIAVSLTN